MTRIHLAGYFLLASALVLAGILLARINTEPAFAADSVSEAPFTVMTARTKSDDESLFVIDNINDRLLIFDADVNRQKLRVVQSLDLRDMFRHRTSPRDR